MSFSSVFMKTKPVLFFSIFCFLTIGSSLVGARPSDEDVKAFDQQVTDERRDFENQLRNSPPGERTQENIRFNQQRAEDRVALEQSLQGLTLEEKQAAYEAYRAKLQDQIQEHNQKLKQLPPEKNNLQEQRKAFDQKTTQKIRDFYSQ